MGRYRMTISRMTVDKLGIKLYDNVSAVVAELVANCYDADADCVRVRVPLSRWLATVQDGALRDAGLEVVVEDDGHGMSPDEANRYFLRVGTDRRRQGRGPTSPKYRRKVMGRKGVGKLAPFGVCRRIEVISSGGAKGPSGYEVSHFIMEYEKIAEESDEAYEPAVGSLDGTFRQTTGTSVRLSEFAHRRIPDAETFHRQLARRFGLQDAHWRIEVDDTSADKAGFTVGELPIETLPGTRIELDGRPVAMPDGKRLSVTGWVAYSKVPYRNEEMAGVRIYARGKIVATTRDFGLSSGFTGEQTIRSYLVGVVNAEWLDDDDYDDLVRTDRQDILWSDPRGEALRDWGRKVLAEIGELARRPLRQKAWEKFLEVSKIEEVARKRFAETDIVKAAVETGRLFGSIASLDELDDVAYVGQLTELALTLAPHKVLVEALREAGQDANSPLEALAHLFGKARVAELAALGQVADERIAVIRNLKGKIRSATSELTLQGMIEGSPWLLNGQWTLLGANESLSRLRDKFEHWFKGRHGYRITTSAIAAGSKRPDFVLLGVAGGLEIVEIKKPRHKLTNKEWERLQLYSDSLTEFLDSLPTLKDTFPGAVHTTLVCDSVSPLTGAAARALKAMRKDRELDLLKWEELLDATERFHNAFLRVARPATKKRTKRRRKT